VHLLRLGSTRFEPDILALGHGHQATARAAAKAALAVGGHLPEILSGGHVQSLGTDRLDGLDAVQGQALGIRGQLVRYIRAGLPLLGPSLDLPPGKAPLPADLEAGQAAVAQHAVDGDAVYHEQVLELPGGYLFTGQLFIMSDLDLHVNSQ